MSIPKAIDKSRYAKFKFFLIYMAIEETCKLNLSKFTTRCGKFSDTPPPLSTLHVDIGQISQPQTQPGPPSPIPFHSSQFQVPHFEVSWVGVSNIISHKYSTLLYYYFNSAPVIDIDPNCSWLYRYNPNLN